MDILLLSSQFCIVHIHRQELSSCSLKTNKHSQFGIFPIRFPRELSRIAFPILILLKDDRTDFVLGEQRDLPYRNMILAICVVIDESKMSGHSDLGMFSNFVASSTFT